MDRSFRERLPSSAVPLVAEIEEALGRAIEVRQGEREMGSVDAASLWCGGRDGNIYYFHPDDFVAQAGVHELLHLHRWWVEKVPQLVPVDEQPGNTWRLTSQIENALEHLVIVPREADYGFEPYNHWNRVATQTWAGQLPGWQPHLLAYLTVDGLVTDQRVKDNARRILRERKLLEKAITFSRAVRQRLAEKRSLLSFVVPALGLDPADHLMMFLGPEDYAALSRD
jgi:hypothetical protein